MKDWIKTSTLVALSISVIAFELFNYATTDIGVKELFGDVRVFGLSLSAMFAIAFCLADIGGIARIFTPETNLSKESTEILLGIGAWVLAAVINAIFTWYSALSLIVVRVVGNELVTRDAITHIAPVIIAIAVLLIRFMLINSLAYGFEHRKRPVSRPAIRPTNNRPIKPEAKEDFDFAKAFSPIVRSK